MQTNQDIIEIVKPYTICDTRRTTATIEAVRHIITKGVSGALVECGVYKGGQIMAMLEVLKDYSEKRDIYLYDTFEGMSRPEECDFSVHFGGCKALEAYSKTTPNGDPNFWAKCSLDIVKKNIERTGYDMSLVSFIKGKVEDTIPDIIPNKIAVLRLDTDWYSSTKHELEFLYPILNDKGVLMIDDYGHWGGARKATDEYIKLHPEIKLEMVDYTGAIFYKA